MKFRLLFGVIAVFLFASVLRADNITVTLFPGSQWTQIAPNTFVVPADLTSLGLGQENEPAFEPPGDLIFNVAFASSGRLNIFEGNTGVISDEVLYFTDNTGHGQIVLYSDPFPGLGMISNLPATTLCSESDSAGCVASFTIKTTSGSTITITGAFDGENSFDPFGAGFDTSDGLKVSTPEPGSFALLASGLVGLTGMLRKKKLLSR